MSGRRAVHRFEDRGLLADIGARRHAETADQAGDLVGQDIAEQIGGDDHVELPRIQHELHGAGIDDAIVHRDPAFDIPSRSRARPRRNMPVSAFSTFALCTTVTFLRPC